MLAGRLSGDKVELGLVPLGSIFMGVFCIALYSARGILPVSVVALAMPRRRQRPLHRAAERLPAAAQRRPTKRAA